MGKRGNRNRKRSAVIKGNNTMKEAQNSNDSPVDVAYTKIKEMMYNHQLVPGQKLLYQELAKKLNMSITPVVQALNRLHFLNIVRSERNKGYYVGEVDPIEAKELFMVRESLETYIIPIVVQNLTNKKLDAIEKAMEHHVKALSDAKSRRHLMVIDTNFHLKIIECAEKKVIYNICKLILEQIYLKYSPEYMREERVIKAAEEHKQLFEALKDRDVKRARRSIKQHIVNGSKHVVNSLLEDKRIGL